MTCNKTVSTRENVLFLTFIRLCGNSVLKFYPLNKEFILKNIVKKLDYVRH